MIITVKALEFVINDPRPAAKFDKNYTKALSLYNEMLEHQIFFDTGICDNYWYWELDWSLVGATDQTITHMLAHQEIEYQLIERAVEEE